MTVKKFLEIVKENNIPEDVLMLSDSGWECCATVMDGIWYNKKDNQLVFTQCEYLSNRYYKEDDNWVLIYTTEKKGGIL